MVNIVFCNFFIIYFIIIMSNRSKALNYLTNNDSVSIQFKIYQTRV